jgi:hypothetical protein
MLEGYIITVLFKSGIGVGFSDVLSSLIFLFTTLIVVLMLLNLIGLSCSSINIFFLDNYLKATTVAILYCKSSISLTGLRHDRPFKV